MRFAALIFFAATLFAGAARAQTPVDEFPRGKVIPSVATRLDPDQRFALYLPSNWDPSRRHPLLLIFDPRGRGDVALELFREPAERFGWVIVSSYGTRSDATWEPNEKALRALWPEVLDRFSADRRRVYATGFSGGAFVAWALAATRPVAGVIAAGGHLSGQLEKLEAKHIRFGWFGVVGDADFNNSAMRAIDRRLAELNRRHHLTTFRGAHEWGPPEGLTRAIEWMELEAMTSGTRPRDAVFIESKFNEDMKRAAELEREEPLAALREYESIFRTYEALRDVKTAADRAAALRNDARTRKRLAEEQEWDEHEMAHLRSVARTLARVTAGEAIPHARLLSELKVPALQKRAKESGEAGSQARRLLESIASQTSFYLFREMLEKQKYNAALTLMSVAREIKPESVYVRYNLAAMFARTGARDRALEELTAAASLGMREASLLEKDEDFASLRSDARFTAVLERVRENAQKAKAER